MCTHKCFLRSRSQRPTPLLWLLVWGLLSLGAGSQAADQEEYKPGEARGRYHPAFVLVEELDQEHYTDSTSRAFVTPQGTVSWFLSAIRDERYADAALALNCSGVKADVGDSQSAELADHLGYILKQQALISWSKIPDRPDGQPAIAVPGGKGSTAGEPRRYLRLGTVDGPDFPVAINLARYKPPEQPAIWLFAAETVSEIPELYELHGPAWLEQHLPGWASQFTVAGVNTWEWGALGLFFLLGLGAAWLTRKLVQKVGPRVRLRTKRHADAEADGSAPPVPHMEAYLTWPAALLMGAGLWYVLTVSMLSLTGEISRAVDIVLLIILIMVGIWTMTRVIRFMTDTFAVHLESRVEEEGAPELQKQVTRVAVAGRVLVFVVMVAGVGMILSELKLFETVGVSLLASAGALGILLTIAGGPVLGNLIAGLQVGMTRPVDIGDVIVFEDRYGWVEDLTYTYLVVRMWNQRRLVIPLRHFILTPFENLTKKERSMVRTVSLHVDYRTPIDEVRDEFERFVRDHDDWDGSTDPELLCVGTGLHTMELLGYVSAEDPSKSWFMHCAVREHMVNFVRELEEGLFLPRERVQLLGSDGDDEESELPTQEQDYDEEEDVPRSKGGQRPAAAEGAKESGDGGSEAEGD